MIIGVCGLIGSGKGTVADILVEDYGFEKISFADKLKDGIASVFDWDREMLEGVTKESREWREQPDEFWSSEMGKPVSPRLVLQLFGTDCMRNGFYDGVWVSLVKKKILENPNTNFVLPDTRFKNEIQMIRDLGGKIWWVRRGELPEWWMTAIKTNLCPENEIYQLYDAEELMEQKYPDIHPSEWAWADKIENFDRVFYNEGTLQDLKSEVNKVIDRRL